MKKIGFVGLGNVGQPAALNLLKAGYQIVGFDLRPSAALIEAGGSMASSLEEIAHCNLIIQSLPSAEALADTMDALLPLLPPGAVIADMSSYALRAKQTAARMVSDAGGTMLDCEVSGLPFQVENRTAVLFLSGDHAVADSCTPVFDALAERHFYLGPFGAATKMKLIANFMVCAHNLIGAEALHLGRAAGLDPVQMAEVLKPSAAGSTTFANKAPLMLSRDFDAGRGPFRHMFGYLSRAQALAAESGTAGATPVLDCVSAIYGIAEREGRHDQDIAAIIEVIEELAEREVQK